MIDCSARRCILAYSKIMQTITPHDHRAHQADTARWAHSYMPVAQTGRTADSTIAGRWFNPNPVCQPTAQRGNTNEPQTMQLDKLPKPHQQNQTLLPATRSRIRTTTRQHNTTRLRHAPPDTTTPLGQPTSPRPHAHLRKMRTTSHSKRQLGPRPHRKQTRLHRPRTHTLQPQSRRTKQQQNARTLATLTTHKHTQQTTHKTNKTEHNTHKTPLGEYP